MINWLLAPPIAFLLYILLVSLLSLAGRYLAGETQSSSTERSLYTGGEKLPTMLGVPGYRPFFVIALFFAVLHLGMLLLRNRLTATKVLVRGRRCATVRRNSKLCFLGWIG